MNYIDIPVKKVFPPSKTIPGQEMSIREMINRLKTGMDLSVNQDYEYPDDENDIQIKFNDLTDLDEAKKVVHSVNEKIAKQKTEKINFEESDIQDKGEAQH